MHISDGILRAKLDGELAETEALAVDKHVNECGRCRARAEKIAAQTARVDALLSATVPPGTVDAGAAWTRLQARRAERRPARLLPWRLTPAWGMVAAAAMVGMVLISPPGRALAQRILGLLRVRNVVVVPIDRDFVGEGKGEMLGQLLSDSVTVTKNEAPQTVATKDEATKLAGFSVRLPAGRPDAPRLIVEGARSMYFTASTQRLATLLSVLGRPDLKLPDGLDGARIVVDVPRRVMANYGNCPAGHGPQSNSSPYDWLGCLGIVQVPSPTVITLPELNLNQVAEAGLQLAGMTPAEAQEFSHTVDWTSTMVIPLPRMAASYQNVTVDGVPGVLITQRANPARPPGWGLIWVKNGIVYSMQGFGDPAPALALAGSMG